MLRESLHQTEAERQAALQSAVEGAKLSAAALSDREAKLSGLRGRVRAAALEP